MEILIQGPNGVLVKDECHGVVGSKVHDTRELYASSGLSSAHALFQPTPVILRVGDEGDTRVSLCQFFSYEMCTKAGVVKMSGESVFLDNLTNTRCRFSPRT